MPSITPFLWFDSRAEEAMTFYASIFPRSKILNVSRANGRVMSVTFELEGQRFMGLNAGPHHTFNEAVSFLIGCESQAEIDDLWEKLTANGGEPGRCGWLKDRFGLSWQVVPNVLGELLGGGGDPARAQRVGAAMMAMGKLDVAALRRAYDGA